jgi:hypothetical protein
MLYLVERPPKYWYAAFEAAGLQVICEPVMPQFGIACLRGINRLILLLRKQHSSVTNGTAQEVVAEEPTDSALSLPALSLPRRLRREVLERVRACTLFFCHPLDHWLRLPLPPARFRTYRVFVLGKR